MFIVHFFVVLFCHDKEEIHAVYNSFGIIVKFLAPEKTNKMASKLYKRLNLYCSVTALVICENRIYFYSWMKMNANRYLREILISYIFYLRRRVLFIFIFIDFIIIYLLSKINLHKNRAFYLVEIKTFFFNLKSLFSRTWTISLEFANFNIIHHLFYKQYKL